jgi:class 3 adenylate cyclase
MPVMKTSMTVDSVRRSDRLTEMRKVVLYVDICSSATILEKLLAVQAVEAMFIVVTLMKRYLNTRTETYGFTIYKFTGDGWILLFEDTTKPEKLARFLRRLSRVYMEAYNEFVAREIDVEVAPLGLTFGIDRGRIKHFIVNGGDEYIGRPLVIASRLQSVASGYKNAAFRAVVSQRAYNHIFKGYSLKWFQRDKGIKRIDGETELVVWTRTFTPKLDAPADE